MNDQPIVFYHAQCLDGFAAAWAVTQFYAAPELVPVSYGAPVPLERAKGRDVIVADFSWKRNDMKALILTSRTTRVYDHHATAREELFGILEELQQLDQRQPADKIVFDENRSGCGITWDELLKGHTPKHWPGFGAPWVIDYVEDRDLWRFHLESSREVNAFIGTLPYDDPSCVAAWNDAVRRTPLTQAKEIGAWVLRATDAHASSVCVDARLARVLASDDDEEQDGRLVPSVNAAKHNVSEVLAFLLRAHPEAPFVHAWRLRRDGMYEHSLRSRAGSDVDVSAIARANGGGGHKHAAGFETWQPPDTEPLR